MFLSKKPGLWCSYINLLRHFLRPFFCPELEVFCRILLTDQWKTYFSKTGIDLDCMWQVTLYEYSLLEMWIATTYTMSSDFCVVNQNMLAGTYNTNVQCVTTKKSKGHLHTAAEAWNLTTLVAIYVNQWRHILRRQQFSFRRHTRISLERITLNVSFECAYV